MRANKLETAVCSMSFCSGPPDFLTYNETRQSSSSVPQSSNVSLSLKYREVLVAHSRKKSCTADGSRAAANEGNLCPVALRELVQGGKRGVSNLRNFHLLEYLHGGRGREGERGREGGGEGGGAVGRGSGSSNDTTRAREQWHTPSLPTSVANCCSPPMLIGPSSEA